MSRFYTLLLGRLDKVLHIVDDDDLTDSDVRAVLSNLINRVARIEKQHDDDLELLKNSVMRCP